MKKDKKASVNYCCHVPRMITIREPIAKYNTYVEYFLIIIVLGNIKNLFERIKIMLMEN